MKKPRQATFAESGFERHRKVTRREKFLAEMDQVVLDDARFKRTEEFVIHAAN